MPSKKPKVSKKLADFIKGIYYWIQQYIYWGQFEKKHISVKLVGKSLKVSVVRHDDFIKATNLKIEEFRKKHPRNLQRCLAFILQSALDGCNFVTLTGKNDKDFIQFWTGKGGLLFDYPVEKEKVNGYYYVTIVGMLAIAGFIDRRYAPECWFSTPKYNFYSAQEQDGFICINAEFGKNVAKASAFAAKVIEEVFQITNHQLVVELG